MSKYIKLSDIEHVLTRPGMYIGSIQPETTEMFVFDTETEKIIKKEIVYSPGLYKIVDEILVNALDHATRTKDLSKDQRVSEIKVTITADTVSVWNNGLAIPVILNENYNEYNPEVVFGNLRSSENFDDTSERRVGGTNGLGSKVTNIFSKSFIVDVGDSINEKKFHQEFSDNMSKRTKAKVTNYSAKKSSFTMITFTPDFTRFGSNDNQFSKDDLALLTRRVFDIVGCSRWIPGNLKLSLNGTVIKMNKFADYPAIYDGASELVSISPSEHWDISVGLSSTGTFEQVSFVNGVYTRSGGKHVDTVVSQIIDGISAKIAKTHKDQTVKKSAIKNNLNVFIRASIDRPAFSSQSKDELTTPKSKFGSTFDLPTQFIDKIGKLGLYDLVINSMQSNIESSLKKNDGKKKNTVNVPKYTSAQFSGTSRSKECTLILSEGDSAKTLIMAGLTMEQRKFYGIFPLKGKMLNVREVSSKKLQENEEIINLKKILGLEHGKVYTNLDSLRYGHIMIATDQDHDGSHIKGLLFNIFSVLWPSLFKFPTFLSSFQTPIVRATKGSEIKSFYNLSDYNVWKATVDTNKWTIKYYKGLGTSTRKEALEYFSNTKQNTLTYEHTKKSDEAFDMAFNKKRADDRKEWLSHYDFNDIVDTKRSIPLESFINQELIHFSNNDLSRSIPNVIDGLKVSQRKVLFSAFKRNLTNEVKVSQFAGYTSEHSGYHHGEKSLEDCIIGLARDFVGTNNVNLLMPQGQFGSRLTASDSASSRYIFTQLNPITKLIFNESDNELLEYLDDDGSPIEPRWYIPVIPMILVNGSRGIGTGFSSFIPCYNPKDIIVSIKNKIHRKELKPLVPWYNKFRGTITEETPGNYLTTGVYTETNDKVIITELPIGTWTEPYTEWLREDNKVSDVFKNIVFNNTDVDVHITLTKSSKGPVKDLVQLLKLSTKISTSNMHAFDSRQRITKYNNTDEIISAFYEIRKDYYTKRKEYILNELKTSIGLLEAKVAFIMAVLNGTLDMRKETVNSLTKFCTEQKFPKQENSFNYLMHMRITSLTADSVEKLQKQLFNTKTEHSTLNEKSIETLWVADLDNLAQKLA